MNIIGWFLSYYQLLYTKERDYTLLYYTGWPTHSDIMQNKHLVTYINKLTLQWKAFSSVVYDDVTQIDCLL